MSCVAISCSNARYKRGCAGKSFHNFPKDADHRRKWLQNAGREDLLKVQPEVLRKSGYRLCSDHFEDHQFTSTLERHRLMWNAVPTVFSVTNKPLSVTRKIPYLVLEAPPNEKTIQSPQPEKLNSRSDLETMVTQTHRPEQKTISLTPKEVDLLKASKKASSVAAQVPKTSLVQVVHLDPVTRRTTYVPVDLPDLPPEQSSGQDCRQPVLQSSGPASRESSCQTSSQQCQSVFSEEFGLTPIAVKTEQMDEDHVAQDDEEMVVHQTPDECTVLPVKVKMEPVEEDGDMQCFEEREVHQTPEEFAMLPVEVKMESVEEDGNICCFQKREVLQTPQEFAIIPEEVQIEPVGENGNNKCFEEREVYKTPQEFATIPVEGKMEPVEKDGDTQCFEEKEVHQTPQEFTTIPDEVKMEPNRGYSATLVQVKTEAPDS